jgi:hypothetical protein
VSLVVRRLLGTPNETLWQGVSQLPDFKTNFPKWQPKSLRDVVPQADRLNDAGLELVAQMLACETLAPSHVLILWSREMLTFA